MPACLLACDAGGSDAKALIVERVAARLEIAENRIVLESAATAQFRTAVTYCGAVRVRNEGGDLGGPQRFIIVPNRPAFVEPDQASDRVKREVSRVMAESCPAGRTQTLRLAQNS